MTKITLPYGKQWIFKQDIDAVKKTLASDWITQGPKIDEFEHKLAAYCGKRYAVAVSSGTAGLHIACLTAGLKKGDEAITTPMTFIASANAIVYAHATPVLCDIEPRYQCIDIAQVKKHITSRTKAIIPVDFAGHPADVGAIRKLVKKKEVMIIEDACHSFGALYKGNKIGRDADMVVLSFHPVKHLTTGEGGAVLTDNKALYEKLKLLRSHGIVKNAKQCLYSSHGPWYYEMQELGFNYRITDFQAALGIAQLAHVDMFIQKRRALARAYDVLLGSTAGVHIPQEAAYACSSYHLYVIRLKNSLLRKSVFTYLRNHGIGVQVHYVPVHFHPYYQKKFKYKPGDFPCAEKYYEAAISIPLFAAMKKTQVRNVADCVKKALVLNTVELA